MNISLKTRYLLIGVATFVVVGLLLVYLAIPTDRRNPLAQQLVGPFDLENTEAEKVLQVVVDSAPHGLRIKICKNLAKQRITIKTNQPERIGQVLGDVAVQLRTGIGDEFQPHFRCRQFFDDSIVIEKHIR